MASNKTFAAVRHSLEAVMRGDFSDIRLPPDVQKARVTKVLNSELTAKQRSCVLRAMQGQSLSSIAREDGVCLSTVSRNFHRGMKRLQRFLRY